MRQSDYRINKGLSYVFLVLSIAAFLGAILKGAWHQLFIAAIAVFMYFVMRPKKWIHIPDETYDELNKQIERAISEMESNSRRAVIETEIGDCCVTMTVELQANVTTSTFHDDAWGHRKKFTETNFYCYVEILSINVFNNGHQVDSDFDEDYIQIEYESTEWK